MPLFCGSAFKTFVLATYLKEVEAECLSELEQLVIDDSIRSVGGGGFEHLSGTTEARNVLEAMIAHSDNTATDVALHRVGPENVRAFISEAGLQQARIPDSDAALLLLHRRRTRRRGHGLERDRGDASGQD